MKFILLLSALFLWVYSNDFEKSAIRADYILQDQIKSDAFAVLTMKCNSCHAKKKKQDIFTIKNMDSLASAINTQVFIKKKMPKGRKIKLTDEELSSLKEWLDQSLK